jgi:hypothetical protein
MRIAALLEGKGAVDGEGGHLGRLLWRKLGRLSGLPVGLDPLPKLLLLVGKAGAEVVCFQVRLLVTSSPL